MDRLGPCRDQDMARPGSRYLVQVSLAHAMRDSARTEPIPLSLCVPRRTREGRRFANALFQQGGEGADGVPGGFFGARIAVGAARRHPGS